MVYFVDVLVRWAPVERTMVPVVPCVFKHEEDQDLVQDLPPGWEGNGGRHAHCVCHWVEDPYLR